MIVLVGYSISGTVISATRSTSGLTTQFAPGTEPDHASMPELIDFLISHQINRGYTNYWISYPLAFLSDEELIFTPELPYHQDFRYTTRDNRYPVYNDLVAAADNPAYLIDNFPVLTQRIRDEFSTRGITWKESRIGRIDVLYGLSSPIRPADLQLSSAGESQQ